MQRLSAAMAPRGAVEHVELVSFRIAQREQLRLGAEDQVQRVHGQMLGYPARGRDDAGAYVALMPAGLARDQREQPLGVGLSLDQHAVLAELVLQLGQTGEHAVVGEQASLLLEGVGVGERERARGGEADVRQERARALTARLALEVGVTEGRDRRLVHDRVPPEIEDPEARPIGVAMALDGEAVGSIQQPELGAQRLGSTAHAEQATHLSSVDGVGGGAGRWWSAFAVPEARRAGRRKACQPYRARSFP